VLTKGPEYGTERIDADVRIDTPTDISNRDVIILFGYRSDTQFNPAIAGNDDWKAGVYSATGVPGLRAFSGVKEASIMGWFKTTGPNPNPNFTTPDPADYYDALGLAGVLTGDSQGHNVRALLEVISVSGQLRVVALRRRIDTGSSQTFAANEDCIAGR
jgi:hypothetical protein